MAPKSTLDDELVAEIAGIAEQASCELVHCEFRGGALRIFLDRPEGVTLTDCETVSKQLSALLDVLDFGSGHYTLEVSSPGLDRQLYGPRDYEKFCGRLVRVTFSDRTVDPARKKTIVGRLDSFHPPSSAAVNGQAPAAGAIRVADPATDDAVEIALPDVRLARLEIEI